MVLITTQSPAAVVCLTALPCSNNCYLYIKTHRRLNCLVGKGNPGGSMSICGKSTSLTRNQKPDLSILELQNTVVIASKLFSIASLKSRTKQSRSKESG